ncbi:hypothetical protein EDD27_8882 [Nonomuraea polychroma]|uniref:Uncharacterized protein n=1 Tax=Nonomuraea polychroma TaxID=46176 RepID=A0A438MJF0_9ACTN|nr:hypothetical protein [Nonomuraea polychroma]RVX46040.1 hypothetical protein EDD27_8882 [Nonomuraea polychroma]
MNGLAHFLDGLRCAACKTLNALWLDQTRATVECRECGQSALVFPEIGEGQEEAR